MKYEVSSLEIRDVVSMILTLAVAPGGMLRVMLLWDIFAVAL